MTGKKIREVVKVAGMAFIHANCIFRRCELEMDYASYLRYLISRHASLNLPYSFATKLSFLASPLVLGRTMLIHDEDTYEKVGAFGFAYGTGPGEYEDRENCQLEVFFIEEKRRTPDLLLSAASELASYIREGYAEVRHIQFWVQSLSGAGTGRLLRRIAALPGASLTDTGALTLYKLPLEELERWIRGLKSKRADRRKIRQS